MYDIPFIGQKYLWCSNGATCEFHGSEKVPWTYLAEHLPAGGSAIRDHTFSYTFAGFWAHRLSRYGAWKSTNRWLSSWETHGQDIVDWIDQNINYCDGDYNCVDDIYVFGVAKAGIATKFDFRRNHSIFVDIIQNFMTIHSGLS